jgi:hypothetical protein
MAWDSLSAYFHHRFGLQIRLFGYPGSKATSENDCFQIAPFRISCCLTPYRVEASVTSCIPRTRQQIPACLFHERVWRSVLAVQL